jgi:hypothetical protein
MSERVKRVDLMNDAPITSGLPPMNRHRRHQSSYFKGAQERKLDWCYSISLSARSNNAGDRDLEASKVIEPRLVSR